MSGGGGHGTIVRVEADVGPVLEAHIGCGLEVNAGPILEVSLGIKQEPKVKAITELTPKMSGPIPWTISGNPQIGE